MRRRKATWMVAGKQTKKNNPKKNKMYTGIKSPKSSKPRKISEIDTDDSPSIRKKPSPSSPVSTVTTAVTTGGDFPAVVPDSDFFAQSSSVENDHIYPQEKQDKADGEWDIIEERKLPFKRTGRNVERNENIIWDILSASQPYHDHSYTTVFGKRKAGQAFEDMAMLELEDEEQDEETRLSARTSGMKFSVTPVAENEESADDKPVVIKVGDGIENKMHIPMVKVEFTATQEGATFVSSEVMGHSINSK
jgi:hypothetical protein